jgi:hypothetical protein
MPNPTEPPPSTARRVLTAATYSAVVILALAAIGLILLLPERAIAVGLVYQGF